MKTQNVVRTLTLLGILLLFCPFFKACGFVKKTTETTGIVTAVVESDSLNVPEPDSLHTEDLSERSIQTADTSASAPESKEEAIISGWDFAIIGIEDFPDSVDIFLLFTASALLSVIMLLLSLKLRFRTIIFLAYVTILCVVIPLLLLLIEVGFEMIEDIRYGYPLYIINAIAIIVFCKKAIRQNAI